MSKDTISLNYLEYDLDRATELSRGGHGEKILAALENLHEREIPNALRSILQGATGRQLRQEERMQLKRICNLKDLELDVDLAETEALPKAPFDFMLEGVVRDFLRNLETPAFRAGKGMHEILTETQAEDTLCPEAMAVLLKCPSHLTKSAIAIFVWHQMAFDYRRAVAIVKAANTPL